MYFYFFLEHGQSQYLMKPLMKELKKLVIITSKIQWKGKNGHIKMGLLKEISLREESVKVPKMKKMYIKCKHPGERK